MDPSASSGLNVTVVGVTTVFLALSLLLGVVTIMAKLVGGDTTAAPPGARPAATPDTATCAPRARSLRTRSLKHGV